MWGVVAAAAARATLGTTGMMTGRKLMPSDLPTDTCHVQTGMSNEKEYFKVDSEVRYSVLNELQNTY